MAAGGEAPRAPSLRMLFLASAAIHSVLTAAIMLPISLLVLAGAGLNAAVIIGGIVLARGGGGRARWVGTAAGIIAVLGWGSWPVIWFADSGAGGAPINIWGILLPGLAAIVYLVAALLPSARGAGAGRSPRH